MSAQLTAKGIAAALGISKQAVLKRADREIWTHTEVLNSGGGGCQKVFALDALPDEVQVRILAQGAGRGAQGEDGEKLPALYKGERGEEFGVRSSEFGVKSPTLTEKEKQTALARVDLVRFYQEHIRSRRWGRKAQARESFCLAYNSGAAYPQIYEVLGETSWKTIERWKVSLRQHKDAFLLADRRGKVRRGSTSLAPDQMKVLTACACHPNRPNLAEAIRMARAVMEVRSVGNGHSDDTYRRFLLDYRDRNFHIWTFCREGAKAWNDKVAFSIERDLTLLNVGDVLVADGHVLNFEVLNPWTGKPRRMTLILWYDMRSNYPTGWEIMPEENTQAIASALRRAILRLGFAPRVAYLDNGKAFGARFFAGGDARATISLDQAGFEGLFSRLGVKTIFAWPYHAQSKTVERFFRTFGELERWMPTYVGTSIGTKPPRLNRGEALHRKVFDKVMRSAAGDGRATITLEQAHWAVATWFDEYARRPQRGHLKGATPQEVFEDGRKVQGAGCRAINSEELRGLMMSAEVRHIRANGVALFGRNYFAPELYGRRHPVRVHYDLQDASSIEVYDLQSGDYLCTAEKVGGVHPAARILGTEADVAKLEDAIAMKKRQEREASAPARAFLEAEVLPEYRRMLDAQGLLPDGEGVGESQRSEVRDQGSEKPDRRRAAEIRVLRTQLDIEEEQGQRQEEATGTDGARALFSMEATDARMARAPERIAPWRSSIDDPVDYEEED